jgi:hypothetical protein
MNVVPFVPISQMDLFFHVRGSEKVKFPLVSLNTALPFSGTLLISACISLPIGTLMPEISVLGIRGLLNSLTGL